MTEAAALQLTVVGSAPAYTLRAGRSSSCYLVSHGDVAIVLDLGQGSFSELARYRAPESVAAVLISHLHADHLVDLVPLRHFLRYEADSADSVALHGPHELRRRFDAFQAESGFLDALPGDALAPGAVRVAAFVVEARRVTHIPDSFAFRISVGDDGPGLVYSGDCGRADDLLPLVRRGDTLLCEAAFGTDDTAGGMHLSARQAARVASEGGASRLLLTHILDRHDEEAARRAAAEVFDGPTLIAAPGLSLGVAGG